MVQCETISGRRVLFVMAVEAEYGPHLRARFTPLMTAYLTDDTDPADLIGGWSHPRRNTLRVAHNVPLSLS